MTKLFNKCLKEGIFPKLWKMANVKPIFKNKGSQFQPTNYRPISLLSCVSKIFEKNIFNNIYTHICDHHLLSEKQSGYRPDHSTHLQLIYLTHNLYKALDSGLEFTAIYLDISKYFDKIWHEGLLHKCKNDFGITGTNLTWLNSYLTDRTQKVTIENSSSTLQTINAGCPQGSVLGPLLALIYLDGLSTKTSNDTLFFADDTSLYASHSKDDFTTTQISLQNDLDKIQNYGRQWKITFNGSKTTQQTFSLKNSPSIPTLFFEDKIIPLNNSHRHLGVYLSNDLKFKIHVNEIIKKVTKALGPLYPISKHVPRNILHQLYVVYIRPYFDYCDSLYDGLITKTDVLRLEPLQNRTARLITGTMLRTPTTKITDELGWTTLENRRKMHKLLIYHKLHTGNTPSYIHSILPDSRSTQTRRCLRNSNSLTQPFNRTSLFQNSFIPGTTRLWNTLPSSVRQLDHANFKRFLYDKFSPPKPPAYFTVGSKLGNILHTRLRLGASQLNDHLYKYQITDSPSCSCGYPSETIEHFILFCTLHSNTRKTLIKNISAILNNNFEAWPKQCQLNLLINGQGLDDASGREVAYCFQKYLIDSKRFR